MIKITEKFSNGSLEDFEPTELMKKVQDGGYSLNTYRTYGNDRYIIFIQYGSFIRDHKGADNEDELYDIDVIKEDANGKQNRILIDDGLTSREVVKALTDWKNSVIRSKKTESTYAGYSTPKQSKIGRTKNKYTKNTLQKSVKVTKSEVKKYISSGEAESLDGMTDDELEKFRKEHSVVRICYAMDTNGNCVGAVYIDRKTNDMYASTNYYTIAQMPW